MKKTIIFIILLGLTACKNHAGKNQSVSTENDSIETIQYSESELISFLDSVGRLNPDSLVEGLSFIVDSTLYNQTILNHELSISDFEKLKKVIKEDDLISIDIDFAKKIFPKLEFDSALINRWGGENNIPICFYSFDKNENDFKEFAILIGCSICSWEGDVYFFYNKKVIAKHSIFYRYGLEIEHFKDENNRTVIYYRVNYGSGTGIWWHQYNFYRYNKDQLVPILTEIQNINLQYPWHILRTYWIEAEIVSKKPLQLKFVYDNQFYDMSETGSEILDEPRIDFIRDSTIVTYYIDKQSGKFIPDFSGTRLNKNKLLSYFHTADELLFVNVHYDLLKNKLNENDTIMRKAILNYLNDLKNDLER